VYDFSKTVGPLDLGSEPAAGASGTAPTKTTGGTGNGR